MRLSKPAFPGREALLRERSAGGPKDRLVPLIVECGFADAPATASVLYGKERVGLVMSGGFGHRIGRSIALAYVRADLSRPGTRLSVRIFGEMCAATVGVEPLYDPNNERLRA